MTTVSLITGCYNGEKFITRCFDSILRQTYAAVEVIFVDDGSTDDSLKIAESYRQKFKEKGYAFTIVAQQNMGFYPQSGIKIATGKYIATLDIDDILLPESIAKRAKQLTRNPEFSASRSNGFVVYQNDTNPPTEMLINISTETQAVFENLLYGKTTNIPGTYMVRADILFEYYPDKVVPMNRFTQNLQILMPVTYNRKVGFIAEPLMEYYRHDEAFTADRIDYQSRLKQFKSFREVRIDLLHRMNLMTPEIQTKLNKVYDNIFLGLAYKYKMRDEFNRIFYQLEKPDCHQKILHAEINGKKFTHFILRIKNKIWLR